MESATEVDLEIVSFYGRHEAPGEFAGVWHSPNEDLNFVRFVGDAAAHLEELQPRLRYPDRLRALPARFSLVQLDHIADEISDAFNGGGAHNLRNGVQLDAITVDFELNRTVVELIASDTRALEEHWNEQYEGAVLIELIGPPGTIGSTRTSA